MQQKKVSRTSSSGKDAQSERLSSLNSPGAIAGIPGPGRWLKCSYIPTALFSLKRSQATSSVGKVLVVPTTYSIKMAFVDAAFRVGLSYEECADFLSSLVSVAVRVAPTQSACVTHTFIKVRQEPKTPDPLHPYIDSVAYREFVHLQGSLGWAFDLAGGDDTLARRLVLVAPYINYIGKRGSFIQFIGMSRQMDLGPDFTQPLQDDIPWTLPLRAHIAELDDFGPEADLDTLSSYTGKTPKRERHRRFLKTIIPLGLVNSGPGFTEYRME